jgi:hypothetical protein
MAIVAKRQASLLDSLALLLGGLERRVTALVFLAIVS